MAEFNPDAYLADDAGFDPDAYLANENITASPSGMAHMNVRAVVGGSPAQDRLANIQRFYPDARPYGDDNFAFTDPQTGKPSIYNPKGLDWGDAFSVGREASQTLGGIVGGAVPIATGVPTGGTSLATLPVAIGLGTEAGGQIWDLGQKYMSGMIDTRSTPRMLMDAASEVGAAAGGQRVGELLGEGAKSVLRYGKKKVGPLAQSLYRDFQSAGVRPTAGAVTGSKTLQGVEQGLSASPGSAGTMQSTAEESIGQVSEYADDVASKYGRVQTNQELGETIVDAASGAAQRIKTRSGELYDTAYDLVGADAPAPVSSVAALLNDLNAGVAQAPESLSASSSKALDILNKLISDAGDSGTVPFSVLRKIRTNLGKDLDNPIVLGATGSQADGLNAVYRALSDDLTAAASNASGAASKSMDVANRYYRYNMNQVAPLLEKIAKYGDEPEKALVYALQGAEKGGSRLARLRRNVLPEEWDDIAGTVIGKMGRATPGAQNAAGDAFSVSTFLTNYNRLAQSPESLKALFGGTRYKELAPKLDRLVRVVGALKEVEKMGNPSGTARVLGNMALIGAFGGLAYGSGQIEGPQDVAKIVAGSILAPRFAAKLITSPRFVGWLADAGSDAVSANNIPAILGRLGAIAKVEPELTEALGAYADSVMQQVGSMTNSPQASDKPVHQMPSYQPGITQEMTRVLSAPPTQHTGVR